MGHENSRFAQSIAELQKLPLQVEPRHRIQGAERLVEQQQRWIGGQRPRHADALALPPGKLPWIPVRKIARRQSHLFEKLIHAGIDLRGRPILQLRNQPDIAGNCKVRK